MPGFAVVERDDIAPGGQHAHYIALAVLVQCIDLREPSVVNDHELSDRLRELVEGQLLTPDIRIVADEIVTRLVLFRLPYPPDTPVAEPTVRIPSGAVEIVQHIVLDLADHDDLAPVPALGREAHDDELARQQLLRGDLLSALVWLDPLPDLVRQRTALCQRLRDPSCRALRVLAELRQVFDQILDGADAEPLDGVKIADREVKL